MKRITIEGDMLIAIITIAVILIAIIAASIQPAKQEEEHEGYSVVQCRLIEERGDTLIIQETLVKNN